MSKKVPNRIYIQTEEFEQVHLDRVFSSDTLYFSEDAVETALSKLVIRINSDLFLQGVKSQMNTKATVENTLNEMKSCFNGSKEDVPMKNIGIPQEDYDFLKDLQQELLTQDTDGQAAPRYWGILETNEEPSPEGIGKPVIYMGDGCTMDAKEVVDYIETDYLPDSRDETKDSWDMVDKDNLNDLIEFMHDSFGLYETKIVWVDTQQRVSDQTGCFITKRACKKHIEDNRHHYCRPKTYAMTAWRNPEFERLLTILQNIKFQ